MISEQEIILRLLLAALLSGCVGYERELHGRAAGLRTNMLVGIGACLLMLTSQFMFFIYAEKTAVDPGRIAAQVVSGIGFLGAGTILRFGGAVRGLTTAAGIWAVSAVGLALGAGFYAAAVFSTALMLVVLFVFSRFEKQLRREVYRTLRVEFGAELTIAQDIRAVLAREQFTVRQWRIAARKNGYVVTAVLSAPAGGDCFPVDVPLLNIAGVSAVAWS